MEYIWHNTYYTVLFGPGVINCKFLQFDAAATRSFETWEDLLQTKGRSW